MVNIRDVARRAKVSVATVSRVVSGSDLVRPKTRDRVLQTIKHLGFVPNLSARSLSMGRSRMLGIIISDITNPFFPDLVQRFTDLAEERGFAVLVSHTNYEVDRAGRAIERMLAHKVEGVAIMTSELHEGLIRQLTDALIPVVFLDSYEGELKDNLRIISIDYETGIHEALDHLIDLGHKRIAFISGPLTLRSAVWRQGFFLKLLRERRVTINSQTLAAGNHQVDGGFAAMRGLLKGKKLPTAVLTSNDLTAIGAISAICEAGMSVPGDISVVGFDDIQISAAYNPQLSTIQLSRTDIATRAFEALYAATQGDVMPSPRYPIRTRFIARKSTARPRTKSS